MLGRMATKEMGFGVLEEAGSGVFAEEGPGVSWEAGGSEEAAFLWKPEDSQTGVYAERGGLLVERVAGNFRRGRGSETAEDFWGFIV